MEKKIILLAVIWVAIFAYAYIQKVEVAKSLILNPTNYVENIETGF